MHRLTEVTLTGSHDDVEWFVDEFETAGRDLNLMIFRQLFNSAFTPRDDRDREHVNVLVGHPNPVVTAPVLAVRQVDESLATLELSLGGAECVTKDIVCLAGLFSLSLKASLSDLAGSDHGSFAAHLVRED